MIEWEDSGEPVLPEPDPLGPTYHALFISPLGQVVLDDLIANFYNQLSYIPGRTDLEMAWHEGQRSVVEYIKSLVKEFSNGRDA